MTLGMRVSEMTFITPDSKIINKPFSVVIRLECGGYRVTNKSGTFIEYYDQQHKHHRIDGPALQTEHLDVWCKNGLIHRKDGPAKLNRLLNIEEWYWYGRLHREDGPARTTRTLTEWYRKGHLHRTDGPAVIHKNGSMEWRYRGGFHRTDGPCYVDPTGKPVLWGYYGKRFMRMTDYLDHAKLAESTKTELMLIYGV